MVAGDDVEAEVGDHFEVLDSVRAIRPVTVPV